MKTHCWLKSKWTASFESDSISKFDKMFWSTARFKPMRIAHISAWRALPMPIYLEYTQLPFSSLMHPLASKWDLDMKPWALSFDQLWGGWFQCYLIMGLWGGWLGRRDFERFKFVQNSAILPNAIFAEISDVWTIILKILLFLQVHMYLMVKRKIMLHGIFSLLDRLLFALL